ncbi:MAG TPA: hypothetical protein VFZ21_00470, partial [Gemmatimonadaceae bacterium]|nr:hypothetical protein [Gemmatimonadaceae bacterium]
VACAAMGVALALMIPAAQSDGQMATLGAGMFFAEDVAEPVYELHVATAPVWQTRAYATFSWTDQSWAPVIIAAAERQVLNWRGWVTTGLGAGAVIVTDASFDATPVLVSSTVVPLRIPRVAVVAIVSTAPFHEFQSSLVLKASVSVWFAR